jgi:hypothetical protein
LVVDSCVKPNPPTADCQPQSVIDAALANQSIFLEVLTISQAYTHNQEVVPQASSPEKVYLDNSQMVYNTISLQKNMIQTSHDYFVGTDFFKNQNITIYKNIGKTG